MDSTTKAPRHQEVSLLRFPWCLCALVVKPIEDAMRYAVLLIALMSAPRPGRRDFALDSNHRGRVQGGDVSQCRRDQSWRPEAFAIGEDALRAERAGERGSCDG